MMYNVEVMQYRIMDFEIEASSYEDARQKAIDAADMNPDWDQVDAYYKTPDENGKYDE